MKNLDITFAGLINYNNGMFKSDKQRDFLLSRCDGNIYRVSQTFKFGEYDNSTSRNTRSVSRTYHCDDKGIYKVVKTTSKGDTVVFERLQGKALAEYQNKLEMDYKRKQRRATLKNRISKLKAWQDAKQQESEGMNAILVESIAAANGCPIAITEAVKKCHDKQDKIKFDIERASAILVNVQSKKDEL